jgi:polyhydroxybutyrate depolymerase
MSQRHDFLTSIALGSLLAACGGTESQGSSSGPSSSSGEASSGTAASEPTTTDTPTTDSTGPGTSAGETTSGSSGDTSTTADATTTSTTTTTDATTDATTEGTTGTTGAVDCGDSSLDPGDHTIEIEHDGVTRMALVYVPGSIKPGTPAPLVLNFHGFTSDAKEQSQFSAMNPRADAEGFVVAYPQGLGESWNAGACCGDAMSKNVDDVGFVRALVESLEEKLCIDARRVYATGMSNGGFMSHRLACEAADIFAAVAPVSAINGMSDCTPSRPVPVMMFNGTADILVSYDGGGNFDTSAPETFQGWADRDGCTDDAVISKMAGKASCQSHEECDGGVSVTLCTFEDMGHCWPGQSFCGLGNSSTDLSANEEMWAFFSKYTLP